ncbi:MAG TPA: trimethylamine methyltransferase family protein [Thermoplasmata archaeon]
MAIAQIRILSEDDIELVHEKTLRILQETGVLVRSDKALKVLEDGGASVDKASMTARLTEALVKDTIRKMPKIARLCARNPKRDMLAPRDGPPFMATSGTAIYMTDLGTGQRRTTTGKDLRDFMTLCDAMEPLDYVWPIVTAHDEPDATHALSELAISLQSTTKHVQGEAVSAHEARGEIEVGSAIVGGADELSKRPIFSVIQCPICPLEFEKGSVEAVMEFAKAGIPVVSMSMALCGLTSPATLAGTIAIVNAENLASFAISQMTKSGAPVIYSSESVAPNMMTGEIHYGALEEMLLSSAAAQMAKHYGAPSMVGGFGTGLAGEYPGISADPAELFYATSTCLTSTDFASGIGGLDQAKGASLEQIVIDCDLWEMLREMRKKVSLDSDRFVTDLIKSVGPGGTYLKSPHTMKNMRKELFLPSQEKMKLYQQYRLDSDQKKLVSAAKERAKEILASHRPEPLGSDTKRKVDAILKRYES